VFATPTAADQQRHPAEAEQQPVDVSPATSWRAACPTAATPRRAARRLRVRRRGQDGAHRRHTGCPPTARRPSSHARRTRRRGRGVPADEHAGVQRRHQVDRSRTPITVNHRPPTRMRASGLGRPIPSRRASAPRTAAGYQPGETVEPGAAPHRGADRGRQRHAAASTASELLSAAGMRSERYTADRRPPCRSPTRRSPGRSARSSRRPGAAARRSRAVGGLPGRDREQVGPERASHRSSCAPEDDEMPTTETMRAMPMAIPSARAAPGSGACAARRRRPGRRREARSRAGERRSSRVAVTSPPPPPGARRRCPPRRGPSRMATRRSSPRRPRVVGDDDDRRAARVELPQHCQDLRARGGVEVAVGSSASSSAGSRPLRRAIATRCFLAAGQLVRLVVRSRCPSPTRRQRGGRPPPALPERDARRTAARRRRRPAPGTAGREVELLEHEPDPAGAQRRQLPVGQPRHVVPGHGDPPGRRAVERAEHVEHRRLARPDGPTTATSSPAPIVSVRGHAVPAPRTPPGVHPGPLGQLDHGPAHRGTPTVSPSRRPAPETLHPPVREQAGAHGHVARRPPRRRPPARSRLRRGRRAPGPGRPARPGAPPAVKTTETNAASMPRRRVVVGQPDDGLDPRLGLAAVGRLGCSTSEATSSTRPATSWPAGSRTRTRTPARAQPLLRHVERDGPPAGRCRCTAAPPAPPPVDWFTPAVRVPDPDRAGREQGPGPVPPARSWPARRRPASGGRRPPWPASRRRRP
jgi:hypothetical protein